MVCFEAVCSILYCTVGTVVSNRDVPGTLFLLHLSIFTKKKSFTTPLNLLFQVPCSACACAQHAHTVLEDSITCVAPSKMCTVLRIPYEAYVMLLQGLIPGEGVMNNQQDRACKIKSIFLRLDVNGDGVLDADEINTLCNYIGIKCDLELAHRLCSLIGRTGTDKATQEPDGLAGLRSNADLHVAWDGVRVDDHWHRRLARW